MPEVEWIGDKFTYKNWKNISPLVDKFMDIGEEFYTITNWLGFFSIEMDPAFPRKIRSPFLLALNRITTYILRIFSR